MKPLKVGIQLVLLVSLATISSTFNLKKTQGQIISPELVPTVVEDGLSTPNMNQELPITHQSEQLEKTSVKVASVSSFLFGGIGVLLILVILRPQWILGMVRIRSGKVGIVIKHFGSPNNRVIALKGEVGPQAETLSAGWHFKYWSWIYEIRQVDVVKVGSDEIMLVEAKDGLEIERGRVFGKIVECNNFQDARAFLENGGEIGRQQGILTQGNYEINTELFTLTKDRVTIIESGKIGLVEAKDGQPQKPGKRLGRGVTGNAFQDPTKFFNQGGQIGKQTTMLAEGTYQINTNLFKVVTADFISIEPGFIGLVTAKEGESLTPGKNFGKAIKCDNFQDASTFLHLGGQKGKQPAILTPGIYQIHSEIFDIKVVKMTVINQGEVGLVTAKYGKSVPPGQAFAEVLDCEQFQDAVTFLEKGGQEGIQLAILTKGNYQINTDLFEIEKVPMTRIPQGKVGLVTAKYGAPLSSGEALGKVVDCNHFQNTEAFLKNGGQKGIQIELLTEGNYSINTHLFNVEEIEEVNISSSEVGLVEALEGLPLKVGQNFGKVVDCNDFQDTEAFLNNGGQKGKQLAILNTGNYQIHPEIFKVTKIKVCTIGDNKIGLVEAKYGAPLPSGKTLGKVVKCQDFQNAQAFLENKGEKGKQLAILSPGNYQINTDFFDIKEVNMTKIGTSEIGLVKALDGALLPPGQNFGKIVECHDFEDAQNFLENGGQRGEQLAILTNGIYRIHPDLFEVQTASITEIKTNQIGLVEALDGKTLSREENYGQVVDCDDFQNIQKFFENGGQRGQQLAILRAGQYQINTNLFKIKIGEVTKIAADEIGLVTAKDGIPPEKDRMFGQMVDCDDFQDADKFLENDGQTGKQLGILNSGTYYINTYLFEVKIQKLVNIPADELGLVIANDGLPLERGQTLGQVVECNNFQDAQAFLKNGGQKGKQLAFLSTGNYRIHTDLFTVITSANASEYGLKPEDLQVTIIDDDKIGLVTTYDGKALDEGQIAGSIIKGHENFQKGQQFINNGGQQGLQEEILPSGRWNLNPWFVQVKPVGLTVIRNGYVGVVNSFFGDVPQGEDKLVVGEDKLVERGYKGIWKTPLYPGKYPINTRTKEIVIIPTSDLALRWSKSDLGDQSNIYKKFPVLPIRDQNNFTFHVDVTQIIRVKEEDAPKMVSRVYSKDDTGNAIDELIHEVLEPTVKNYFLETAQNQTSEQFLQGRGNVQLEAKKRVKDALKNYNVQAIDTLIGEIYLPDELTELLQNTVLKEYEAETLKQEAKLEKNRQDFLREKELAKMSVKIAQEQNKVEIAEIKREEENKQLEEKREQERKNLQLEKEKQEAQLRWKREQDQAAAEAKKQMQEVDINAERERKDIEVERQEALSQLNTEEMNLIAAWGKERYAEIKRLEISQQAEIARVTAMIQASMASQATDVEKTKAIAKALGNLEMFSNVESIMGGDALEAIANSAGIQLNPLLNMLGQTNPVLLNQLGFDQFNLAPSNSNLRLNSSQPSPKSPQDQIDYPIINSTNNQPRFPLVLLLDTSHAISGEPIDALNKGIAAFKQKFEAETESNLSQSVELGIISCNSHRQTFQGFVNMHSFVPVSLKAEGDTIIGEGLDTALNKIESYQEHCQSNNLQYRKPWLFLIIAGSPTDDWENSTARVRQAVEANKLNCFVVAVQGADLVKLRQVTPPQTPPIMLDGFKFRELFQWLANALKNVASSKVGSGVKLPPITEWADVNMLK